MIQALPFFGGSSQPAAAAQIGARILDPAHQARPVAHQRFVGHLNLLITGLGANRSAQQSRLDQPPQHPIDLLRILAAKQFDAPHPITRHLKSLARLHHPQQHPACGELIFGDERVVQRIGRTSQCQATAADLAVGFQGQPVTIAFAPERQQRKLQQRQRSRFAEHIVQQRINQTRGELEAHLLRRQLDRLT